MQRTGGQLIMLMVINVLLLIVGAAISGGAFLSIFNLQSMASQLPEIALLAIGRTMVGAAQAKRLALGGYLLSAFGALTSVALQIYSFTVIQATCRWCFASAILMVLLLVFLMLVRELGTLIDTIRKIFSL